MFVVSISQKKVSTLSFWLAKTTTLIDISLRNKTKGFTSENSQEKDFEEWTRYEGNSYEQLGFLFFVFVCFSFLSDLGR